MGFTVWDYLIVAVYLGATLTAGLWGKRLIGGIDDYLVAGRGLGLNLGIATLAATEIGTVTFMYYAQLGYRTGFAALLTGLISGVAMLVVGATGFVVSRFRKLELMTVPEYFERRYSRRLRVLAGTLVAIGGLLNMGVFLRVEGTFLMILTGIPMRWLVLVMSVILVLEMLYTVLGGMVSIVITDFLQYVALSLGTILVTLYCVLHVGWGKMTAAVTHNLGTAGWNALHNPAFGWNYIFFQILIWLAVNTCWQTTAMRSMAMRNPELSQRVFRWTGLIYLGRGMLPMLWGIAALAVFGPHHHSMTAMPRLLAQLLGPGVKGLVVAAMLAATMSCNSSYLLGWSSIIAQDVIQPLRRRALDSRAQIRLNRWSNLFVSLFIMVWSLWYTLPGPMYFYLNITATIFLSGTFSAVVGGLYWRRASVAGGYAALLTGALASLGYFFLKLPAQYAGFASFGLAAAALVAGSWLWPRRDAVELSEASHV